ncbi:hypothetical protein F4820DRAFT_420325 [Hypoxylon rubiginosum]|uniref:Uncharacterized protein n=1 Tax=Hypoxylon rubiginosum TaxID=110542 RepID=A0ACB9Z188_9PEZI|nr:hypothetical protein F4820DRAFT_420325 [Hypoxylon rubiginosum]
MAEFCRVVKVAVRSRSLLRPTSKWSPCSFPVVSASTTPSIRQISTAPILWSIHDRNEARGSSIAKPLTPKPQNQSYSAASWSDPTREARPTKLDEDIKKPDMSLYDDPFAPDLDFEIGELSKIKATEERPVATRPPLRLVPRTGRSVQVGRNVDVARSFKLLSVQIAQNQVRRDFQAQRFHERAGLKRKRLNSERWRKRFKKGFKACVSRVKELTKQGW